MFEAFIAIEYNKVRSGNKPWQYRIENRESLRKNWKLIQ
jgi:hypothetical protein